MHETLCSTYLNVMCMSIYVAHNAQKRYWFVPRACEMCPNGVYCAPSRVMKSECSRSQFVLHACTAASRVQWYPRSSTLSCSVFFSFRFFFPFSCPPHARPRINEKHKRLRPKCEASRNESFRDDVLNINMLVFMCLIQVWIVSEWHVLCVTDESSACD